MVTRRSYCLLILLCYGFFARAQGVIVPPSPNAASLGQYGDVPVSNYTGVPDISIPLYTVKSGEIELPISLSYHASGIKVAQEASLVGLGWSLNAGGVITRQVRGMDDFDVEGGYVISELPPSTDSNLPDWSDPNNPSPNTDNFYTYYPIYQDIAEGELDGEPDIFYYNFFGHSGKLLFEKQSGNDIRAISMDQNNIDFIYHKSTRTWEVTDGNGWKYFFGTTEKTDNYTYSDTGPFSLDILEDDVELDDVITAWYIDRVITPKGDEIAFFYNENDHYSTISQVSYSELLHRIITTDLILGIGNGYTSPVFANHALYSANMQEISEIYLNRIEFNNGSVSFALEAREDMRPTQENGTKPQKLRAIEIFDLHNESIKKVDFEYAYRSSRLMLESLQESFKVKGGTTYISKPPYKFTYDPTALPVKNSYSVDHWGYYNARNNEHINKSSSGVIMDVSEYLNSGRSLEIDDEYGQQSENTIKSLVPYLIKLDGTPIFINGADREPNAAVMQAAILKSIQYPTGGISKFTYEPNDYYDEAMPIYNKKDTVFASFDYGEIPPGQVRTPVPFILSQETLVKLSFRMINHAYTTNDDGLINLYEYTNVVLQQKGDFWYDLVKLKLEENMQQFNSETYVLLPPGEYRIFADNGLKDHLEFGIIARYSEISLATKKIGGGIRIQSIDNYEQVGGPLTTRKVYSYMDDNGNSTGRAMSPIQYFYSENLIQDYINPMVGNIIRYIYTANYIVSSSSSVVPLGTSAQGNFIGYDRVTVTEENSDGETLGSTKFYYENKEEIPIESFIPGIPNFINLSNGKLIREEYFNNNDLVKEKFIKYQEDEMSKVSIKGVKLYSFYGSNTAGNEIRFYDVYSEWGHPVRDSTVIYDLKGNNPITSITDYEFNNASHKNLTKTTTVNSKNEVIVDTMEYPSDYPSGTNMSTTDFDEMVGDNVLNKLIRTENMVNGIRTGGTINNFTKKVHIDDNNVQNNMYLPSEIELFERGTASDYEARIKFDVYDDNGNLLQMTKTKGISDSYVWGYNGEYPIARIENANQTEVANAISTALASLTPAYATTEALLASLDDIQSDTAQQAIWRDFNIALRSGLPGSMVTTYTYDPLVGMTSMTDPKGYTIYYIYDSFNRLKEVRDPEGNLVSDYEYHYENQ